MAPRYIFVQVKGNKNGTFTTEQLRTLDNTVFRDFKLEIKARGFDKGDYLHKVNRVHDLIDDDLLVRDIARGGRSIYIRI